MCNLYSLKSPRNLIAQRFGLSDNRMAAFDGKDAIFPGYEAPVIRNTADGEREFVVASWGFVLPQSGRAPKRVTNVRDDKIRQSPFWRQSFEQRRCLVPASSYCEPDSNKPAGWHWFAIKRDEEQRPLFAFPGIWRRWNGPIKKDGSAVSLEVYSFMTTKPNPLTRTIMHDRMPVLLSEEEEFATWLNGTPEEAYSFVRSYPAERMRKVQSGNDKRDLFAA